MRVVVTKKPFKGNAVGTEVEVSARDARVLIAIGRAAVPVVAAVEVKPEPEAKPEPQRRVYRRRDMTAEG